MSTATRGTAGPRAPDGRRAAEAPRGRRLLLWVVVVGGAALLLAHALYFRHLFLGNSHDDAYISYRYADNLVHGRGLVFNAGERVEGYSNFLWVMLLVPFARWHGDLALPSQVLGSICGVGALILSVWALRRILGVMGAGAAAFVVLLLAGSGYVAAWSTAGLESPLYGLLLLAAWARYALERSDGRRWPLAAFLLGAVALTHPEGVFLALAGALLHLLAAARSRAPRAPRATWLFPAIVIGIVAAYEVWRCIYYGPHLLPNSVRAKIGGGAAQFLHGALYTGRNFLLPYLPLLVGGAALGRSRRRAEFVSGYGLFFACLLFVAAAGGDWSLGRLFAPLLPLGAVLFAGALGNSTWFSKVVRRRPARAAVYASALTYLVVAFWLTSPHREMASWRTDANHDAERIAIGKWLAANMPPSAVLAVHAAGQIPYYSGLYAHDMLGLNDPHIAGLHMPSLGRGTPGHEKYDPAYTLEKVRPDIIVEGRLIPGLKRHPLYRNTYQPIASFWRYHEVVVRRDLAAKLLQQRDAPGR